VDTVSGEWGVATASGLVAVGAVVPYAEAGAGAVATQAAANPALGERALERLRDGESATAVLAALLDRDSASTIRQVALVDRAGRVAAHTGIHTAETAGDLSGPGFVVLGNRLAGDRVLPEMERAFAASEGKPLAERLLAALQAGEREGGDRAGTRAAALVVVRRGGGFGGFDDRYLDLRVDDHDTPVAELARLYGTLVETRLPSVHVRIGDRLWDADRRREAEREYARAVHLYRRAIAARPDDPTPRNGLAWFYAGHNLNLDEALQLARDARDLAPNSWKVLDTLAEVYLRKGDLDAAHETAREALVLEPGNPYLQRRAERARAAVEATREP
jgi:uncharacterized Ntn-hydrolase superfamily protein